MDLDARYAINRPLVVSDTIEGETVILHHGTGRYFDTAGTGAFIWTQLEIGKPPRLIAEAVAKSGPTENAAVEAVASFLALLLENDLILSGLPDETFPEDASIATPPSFSLPTLGVHADLADMLLLDPIHDVGPTGWPSRPGTAA